MLRGNQGSHSPGAGVRFSPHLVDSITGASHFAVSHCPTRYHRVLAGALKPLLDFAPVAVGNFHTSPYEWAMAHKGKSHPSAIFLYGGDLPDEDLQTY